MQVYERERQIQREVAATVEERLPDVEVVAAELSGPERLTVYIDHPAGVDHALCEQVTDVLRSYLDHYTLDVSSPGLERPLRKPEHFRNAVGRTVSLRTPSRRKRLRGEVVAADEREVTLATGGARVEIPYEAIARGNLIDEG